MSRLRILLLGPDCNPEQVSMPFVSYCHAAALAQLHDVTIVSRSNVEDSLRRAKAPFRDIEVIRTPLLDRIFAWGFRRIFKSNYDAQLLTAFRYPFSVAFEWKAWRQLRRRIFAGEFDVVLRVMPLSPVLPSPFAFFLRRGPIPFVIGPLQGGLRCAPGFSQPDKRNAWWRTRSLYRSLPFARATYRHAAAIIVASSYMLPEFAEHSDKVFLIPENGIARAMCSSDSRSPRPDIKLRLVFAGGLVPRKACYLALHAAAPLLRKGLAHFTIIGDGAERGRLEQLVKSLRIESAVWFAGWLPSHAEVLQCLWSADVVVQPAIREMGGGVIFEALARGTVPVVVDYGGPGDIVHPGVGYKVPPTSEAQVIAEMEKILTELEGDRDLLLRLGRQGIAYAMECLTWEAKAQATTRVLDWTLRRGPKPDLPWSKMLLLGLRVDLEKSSPGGPAPRTV